MIRLLILIGVLIVFILLIVVNIIVTIRRKTKASVITLVGLIILTAGIGFYTAAYFAGKSYRNIKSAFTPRTGKGAYEAFWGVDSFNCVEIIHFQDQIIPKIDYAIKLHFKTCPQELQRITRQKDYKTDTITNGNFHHTTPQDPADWFQPDKLGDTVIAYTHYFNEYGDGQIIYSNTDSTEVYCIDILD